LSSDEEEDDDDEERAREEMKGFIAVSSHFTVPNSGQFHQPLTSFCAKSQNLKRNHKKA
jgi:hypothetical protein